jgi:hypothetical protein
MYLLFVSIILAASVAASAESEVFPVEPGAPSRVVKFEGGQTKIYREQGRDHVVVRDAKGKISAESYCQDSDYELYHNLFVNLRAALAEDDPQRVSNLIEFPLRVNTAKPFWIRDRKALVAKYAMVFTEEVRKKIQAAEPAAVFCRDGAAMLGNGVVWAQGKKGRVAVCVVNP